MNRTKIIVAGIFVGVVALLIAGSVRLTRSYAAAQEARRLRDSAFGNLKQLYEAKPFPSMENAERMQQDVQALLQMRDALTNAVSARDVARPALSPSRFIQELQTTLRERLQAQAPIVEGVRVVPDNFAFGFERYVAAGAPMPQEKNVPRLAQQLVMIENLVSEVYAAQIGALRSVMRDEFDAGEAEEAGGETESRVSRRNSRREAAGSDAGRLSSSSLYSAQRFTLEVTGRQAAIGDLLNRLAAMKMFVVVTDVELRKSGDDLRAPGAAAAASAVPVAEAVVVEELVSKLWPSKRLVSGLDIDPPISARIELEVISFKKEGV